MLKSTVQLYINSFSGLSREIWLLSAVTLINRIGMMVLPFLTLYTTQELGFTMVEAGIATSFFGFGSLVGSWIGGKMTDRIGEFKTQFWSLFLSGFVYIMLLLISDFYVFCAGIFFAAFIADMFRPAMMSAVGTYSKPENRARAMSLIRLAINLGFSGGMIFGGFLAAKVGYHWLLIIEGVTCIAASVFFYFLLPNQDTERKEARKQIAENEVLSPYRDKVFLIFMVLMLINATAFMQLFSTIPLYFKDILLLGEDQIGLIMFVNGFLLFAFEMPVVYKLENHKNKFNLLAWGTLLIAFSFLVYPVLGDLVWIAVFSIILVTVGEMISFPFSSALVLDRTNDFNRGDYMGLFASTFSVAFIIAPLMGTWIAEHYGFGNLWYFVGGLSVFAAMGMWLLGKNRKGRTETEIVEEKELAEAD